VLLTAARAGRREIGTGRRLRGGCTGVDRRSVAVCGPIRDGAAPMNRVVHDVGHLLRAGLLRRVPGRVLRARGRAGRNRGARCRGARHVSDEHPEGEPSRQRLHHGAMI
jgi:hypothetical protein